MKKEVVIWILLAVLFLGVGILFKMNCNHQKQCSLSSREYTKACKAKRGEKHKKIYSQLCESCQVKVKEAKAAYSHP